VTFSVIWYLAVMSVILCTVFLISFLH
jgi:hypothetical protein